MGHKTYEHRSVVHQGSGARDMRHSSVWGIEHTRGVDTRGYEGIGAMRIGAMGTGAMGIGAMAPEVRVAETQG